MASEGQLPEGISDGLTLPCGNCKRLTSFDYRVTDFVWREVAPDELRLGVICLSCFDVMAHEKRVDVSSAIIEIQFTGRCKTIGLKPVWVHRYGDRP